MSQCSGSQDSFSSELEKANFQQLIEAVAWQLVDIEKSVQNIHQTAYNYPDVYSNKIKLKRAAADLRDILAQMETVEQYMNQQQ